MTTYLNLLSAWCTSHRCHVSGKKPTTTAIKNDVPDKENVNIVFGGKRKVVKVVLLGWLGAKTKHLKRYVEWYNLRGFQVSIFSLQVNYLMVFDNGKRLQKKVSECINEVVSWVSEKEDDGRERCLVFHTFSNTGWLVYGFILDEMQERKDFMEKIKGCVVDSGGGDPFNLKVMAAGFVAAFQKKRYRCSAVEENRVNGFDQAKMQEKDARITETMLLWFFERLCSFLLNLSYPKQKMRRMVSMLTKNHQPNCPQLYLYSTADNVLPFKSIELLIEEQRRYVSAFNFESSPHVDHYRTFPHIYSRELDNFFNQCFASAEPFKATI